MIDIPYEEAVLKIAQDAGITEREVESRIKEKLAELSGLISKDGAAHIVANELNVQLIRPQQPGQNLKIKELKPGMRSVIVSGRVVQKWEIKSFEKNGKTGRVANLLIGDETGVIKLVFWNDQVDVFEELKPQDILVVKNPFVKQGWQDRLELQLNDQSKLDVNPAGVEVAQREQREARPREQKYLKDLQGGEENVEVIGTVVRVYDPRFYDACKQCRKKLVDGRCAEHGDVGADVNFNLAAHLDDGTGNIRVSFWKQQAMMLTSMQEKQLIAIRDDPSTFEPIKNDLLGEIIKVVGSVKKNDTFDRLELNASLVFKDVDPAKELENLEKKFASKREERPAQHVSEEIISLEDLEEIGK